MGVRVARGDVMTREPLERLAELVGKHHARFLGHLPQAEQVVSPGTAPQAMQERLHGELGRLLGAEASPVVDADRSLRPGAGQGLVGLMAPAPILRLVERRGRAHARQYRDSAPVRTVRDRPSLPLSPRAEF